MILTCPACNARFVIESATVGSAGRQVRCGVCSHAWHQASEPEPDQDLEEIDDEEMLEDYAEDDDAPAEELAEEPGDGAPGAGGEERLARLEAFDEERRRSSGMRGFEEERKGLSLLTIAWVALVIFVAALAGIAWFGRDALVAQFPEAAKLYAKVGLAVAKPMKLGEGLELRDVNSAKREVDGKPSLVIEGMVVNVSDETRPVPALRAVITDAEGGQISEWTFATDTESLPPGGRAAFQTSTEDPERGVNLSLIFVER